MKFYRALKILHLLNDQSDIFFSTSLMLKAERRGPWIPPSNFRGHLRFFVGKYFVGMLDKLALKTVIEFIPQATKSERNRCV